MSFPEVISSKMVKARKQYYCDYSCKLIKKGDEYQRDVNVYEGRIYAFRTCKEALYIIDKLDMYGKGTDNDGFSNDDYTELLEDYARDNNLFEVYEAYTGLFHDFVYEHLKKQEFQDLIKDLIQAYTVEYIGTQSNKKIINDPFVNGINEFIAVPKSNSYFRLDDCTSKRDVIKKMLHWLSRDCEKAGIGVVPKYFNKIGFNNFLGTSFGEEDFMLIYDRLGNGINEKLTEDFIDSEYDIDILKG